MHKTSITINFFFSQETDTVDSIPGGEWVTHSSPNECGTHSKSVTLNAGDSEGGEERHDLWLVTGGLVGNNPLARVEAFDGQGWKYTAVKNLPVPVYLHCLVNFLFPGRHNRPGPSLNNVFYVMASGALYYSIYITIYSPN